MKDRQIHRVETWLKKGEVERARSRDRVERKVEPLRGTRAEREVEKEMEAEI